ncbi:MAG TPA: metalloregulator ArsR/SmtB family transcription factor [Candidatus Krumholzibacteria bacterium]|nr:metalloregulator ArsR/SmtB family transcription factor [Candidatus Krumholzibacteria bacterium]
MTAETSAHLLKALADPTRLRILRALQAAPCYVEQLATALDLGAPTISHHLKKLEAAGLVRGVREQYYTVYHLRGDALETRLRELVDDADDGRHAEELRLADYHRKILKAFVSDGRVERLPAQQKKRLVVLEALAADFETGRDYAEPEVNAIIARRHADFCGVRRDFVDFRMMTREQITDAAPIYRLTREPAMDRLPPPAETPRSEQPLSRDERKAKVQLYKQANKRAGVYAVRNERTGRVLLGSARNLHGPLNRHRAQLDFGSHPNKALQKDWRELGADAFAFEILEMVDAKLEGLERDAALKALEQAWIARLQPFGERCYNASEDIRHRAF